MIDIILILLGMCILGYSFYHTVGIVAEVKDHKIPPMWMLSMKFAGAFTLITFFLLSMVFFNFISLYSAGEFFLKMLLSSVFLGGAFLVTLIVKISAASVRSMAKSSENLREMYEEAAKKEEGMKEKMQEMERELETSKASKSKEEMKKKIAELTKELETTKEIAKHAVGRELRMVELKNEIEALKKQLKKKSK